MYKRVTLLERKPSISMEEFSEHWEIEHGPIAANFTGLVRYHQNHRLTSATPTTEPIWPVEGIVELWFDEEAGSNPGRDEGVTAQLIVDEPTIFRSLTGFPVPDCDITSAPTKVWLLGSWADDTCRPVELQTVAETLADPWPGLHLLQTHAVEPDVPPFLRDALLPYPTPPRATAVYEWRGDGLSVDTCDAIEAQAREAASGVLDQIQVVPVREVVIV